MRRYLPIVRAFLTERFGTRPVALETLTAQDANQFILSRSQRFSRCHSKMPATALRNFLRYVHMHGDIGVDLAGAVLPVVNWRLSRLPKALAAGQVESILGHCDRTTSIGRRDYAILILLARLDAHAEAREIAVPKYGIFGPDRQCVHGTLGQAEFAASGHGGSDGVESGYSAVELGSGNTQFISESDRCYVKSGTIEAYCRGEGKPPDREQMKILFNKYMELYYSNALGRSPGGGGVVMH